jgi:hypothetical protein
VFSYMVLPYLVHIAIYKLILRIKAKHLLCQLQFTLLLLMILTNEPR